jgi:hypothetical protein
MDWKQELLETFQQVLTPPDNLSIADWSHKYVELNNAYSIPGMFDVARSRFLLKPLEALKNMNIRQVNIMASPRCCKTLTAELFLLHTIANNAGTFLWLQNGDDMAGKMNALRMTPLLKNCPPVKVMIPDMARFALTKKAFIFPHMTIHLSGAKIKALQSIGYKFIVGDECWQWDQGFIGEAKARQIDFQHTSKLMLISQGGVEGDEWTTEFNNAPLYEWGFKCPKCAKAQVLDWNKKKDDVSYSGIAWPTNDKTKPGGVWNVLEAGKAAVLICDHCKYEIADNPQNRRNLNDNGEYICVKADGNPKAISFRWNALANIEISFSDLVIQYLQSKRAERYEGNKLPIQEFLQKRLAKSYDKNKKTEINVIITAEYDTNLKWGDHTFMTVDCQKDHAKFAWVIRSWQKIDAESRLIRYGYAPTWEELRKIQIENSIRDQNVLVDTGYMATKVYAKIIEYSHTGLINGGKNKVNLSWIGLKGYDSLDFQHPDGTKRLYAPMYQGDPNIGKDARGKTAPVYRWSNYSIKNMLTHLRDGKGAKWLANSVDEEYTRQLNSEVLEDEIDKRTNKVRSIWQQKPGVLNDYFDCECMQIVAACMVNIMGKSS